MTGTLVLDETHASGLRSWVESANEPNACFPIQNLPFGVFRRQGVDEAYRCGVAIGDFIVDLPAIRQLFTADAVVAVSACEQPALNGLMALGHTAASALRQQLSHLLSTNCAEAVRQLVQRALVAQSQACLAMPFNVGGFTDFFASVHHATNAGSLFRPDNPLLPNYKYVPVAYNGRANSVKLPGVVQRPKGQIKAPEQMQPVYKPSDKLDYEVELGVCIGQPSQPGQPVMVGEGWDHVFGLCLLNDWSARDIQAWEYQPLGPFLAKSFATTLSPWVVTTQALAPFRASAFARPETDPAPLPHLFSSADQASGSVSVEIDVFVNTEKMRANGVADHKLSTSDSALLYWTIGQMVAHHTSNGSALDTGDVLGTGTISGPSVDELGSLLEITRGGKQPLVLLTGERRTFLEDGDEVVMRGRCKRDGFVSVGFGEIRCRIGAA